MKDDLRERLRGLPKAELHVHLEGCVSAELLWRLSERQGMPHGLRSLEDCQRLYAFGDFSGFIQAIKTASQHLATPADYALAVRQLAVQLAAQGVVYAEVFVSIGILIWRQEPIEPYWEAIENARQEAEAETGVRLRWLFDAVRQLGGQHFALVLGWAKKLQEAGSVLGIGIGGDERVGPAAWFVPGFAAARALGLRVTAHAGETTGANAVREAMELLRVERIGHALGAFDDGELLRELAARGITVDVCPTSNMKTGCWEEVGSHPVREFQREGVMVAIGSDDPGIFGTSLLQELELLHDRLGYTEAELRELIANSFRASFLPAEEKTGWLEKLKE